MRQKTVLSPRHFYYLNTFKALKIDNYKGSLKKDYVADIVSFSNDPTLNIRNLKTNPSSVIKAGKAIKINGQII